MGRCDGGAHHGSRDQAAHESGRAPTPSRGPQFQRHHQTFWTSADAKCCCSEGAANGKADAGFRETTSIETLASAAMEWPKKPRVDIEFLQT